MTGARRGGELGLWTSSALVVGNVIGSGIFLLPASLAPYGTLSLFGWLLTRADPWTGMWGSPSAEAGRLQVVNGYYRLTRGSFAQFGLPVPHPERVVDAVLDHGRDPRHFGTDRENACNVLDVAHPLWLCTRQLGGTQGGSDRLRHGDVVPQSTQEVCHGRGRVGVVLHQEQA